MYRVLASIKYIKKLPQKLNINENLVFKTL